MKTLRQQLFRSHLLVMFVALGVMVAVTVVLFTVAAVLMDVDLRGGPQRGGSGDDSPLGPLVLLFPMAAAAIAAAFVSWRVAQRLAAPIEAARRATQQLAAARYDVKVDGGSVTELAQLADDVNQLGSELHATEQRRLRLVGDVAHELRNPLATIEASMEALMDGVVPATDETYSRVAREAARLRRLAGDLSELSATAEPSAVAAVEQIDLGDVLTDVVDQLAPQAAAKNLALNWSPGPRLELTGDRDRLTQVFTNIIGNAVQYTEAGSVLVEATVEPGANAATGRPSIRVVVSDTGPGLEPEEQLLVFERFHRANTNTEGTGVGLAIAKSLVEAHGGSIDVASGGIGHGATFTVHLPIGR